MSANALVFLHVPKAAGSTLKWIIRRQYQADSTLIIEGEALPVQYQAFLAKPIEARERLRCVVGHLPYGIHRWLPQGARYITMLRHPIEWTISFHSYIQRMPFFESDPDFSVFRGVRSMDLDGFVDFLARSNMLDMQTRMIAGQVRMESPLPPYAPLKSGALDDAKRTLRVECDCVGVVERFDESLLVMKNKLGWGKIYYRRLNESEGRVRRAELPKATVNRILTSHRRDVELYEEACRILTADIEAGGENFKKQLHRFQRYNAIYTRLLPFYEASGLNRVRNAFGRRRDAIR